MPVIRGRHWDVADNGRVFTRSVGLVYISLVRTSQSAGGDSWLLRCDVLGLVAEVVSNEETPDFDKALDLVNKRMQVLAADVSKATGR